MYDELNLNGYYRRITHFLTRKLLHFIFATFYRKMFFVLSLFSIPHLLMIFLYRNFVALILLKSNRPFKFAVGKQSPCVLSFVYTSQVNLTVRTEPKFG